MIKKTLFAFLLSLQVLIVSAQDLTITKSVFGTVRNNMGDTADYHFIPKSQIQPILLGVEVTNSGTIDQTNITMDANINSGFFTDNGTLGSLLAGDTSDIFTTTAFTPLAVVATYSTIYSVSSPLVDLNPADNSLTENFYITDSVFGLDNGIMGYQQQITSASPNWGNTFEVTSPEFVKSISFRVGSLTTNSNITVEIYNCDPAMSFINLLVQGTATLSPADIASNAEITVQLNGGFVQLYPGSIYMVCVKNTNANNNTYIWCDSDKARYFQSFTGNFNNQVTNSTNGNTPMIRLNFGCPTDGSFIPPVMNIGSATCDGVCNANATVMSGAPSGGDDYYIDLYDSLGVLVSTTGPLTTFQLYTYNNLCVGEYTVITRTNYANCGEIESAPFTFTITPNNYITDITLEDFGTSNCMEDDGSIVVSYVYVGFLYQNPNSDWSGPISGNATAINLYDTITNLSNGLYVVTLSSANPACPVFSDTVTIGLDIPGYDICSITVDSATASYNIIIWEKDLSVPGVDSFYIYREISAGTYTKIGAVAFEDSTVFEDFNANPNQQSWKYKISILDDCGNEGAMGDFHESIHLQYLANGNFIWNHYDIENLGNPVLNYIFYKDDLNNGNWLQIGSPVGNSFTDLSFASTPNAVYRVLVAWNISCSPSRAGVNTSRSNIRNQASGNGILELMDSSISIYPNPAAENVTIESELNMLISSYQLTDASGRVISNKMINTNSFTLDVSEYESGIYFINLNTDNGIIVKKIVKE